MYRGFHCIKKTKTFFGSCPQESLHIQSPTNLVSEFTMEGRTSDATIFESTSILVNDETENNNLVNPLLIVHWYIYPLPLTSTHRQHAKQT